MKKKKFLTPVVHQVTKLELEGAILGSSTDVQTEVVDTGHETFEYTTDSYWE